MRHVRQVGLMLVVLLAGLVAAVTAQAAEVTEFPTPTSATDYLNPPALGADGNIWVSSLHGAVFRVTPSGDLTAFDASSGFVGSLVRGPGGNLWFPTNTPDAIGEITAAGASMSFPADAGSNTSLTEGSDGNLWFPSMTSDDDYVFSRITPAGVVTNFSGATLDPSSQPGPGVLAPDGNIWFVDSGPVPLIGKLTPSGMVTQYSAGLAVGANPSSLTVGPDGNLWFIDDGCRGYGGGSCAVGRITMSGTITEFTAGIPAGTVLNQIIAGPNGALWFDGDTGTDSAGDPTGDAMIGQITTSGVVTVYEGGLRDVAHPGQMVLASDGNVWFVDDGVPNGPALSTTDAGEQPRPAEFGEVTPAGAITETAAGLPPNAEPSGLINGGDGNLWYVDSYFEESRPPLIGRLALQEPPTVGAGTVSGVSDSSATVSAAVDPVGSPVTSVTVEYGSPAGYAFSAPASPASLPIGGTQTSVSAQLSGLSPGTTIQYRFLATNAFGTTDGPEQTVVVPSPSPLPGSTGRSEVGVRVSGFRESVKWWRLAPRRKATILHASASASASAGAGAGARVSASARVAKAKLPVGTRFRFTLTVAAKIKLTFVTRPAHAPARCRRHPHGHGCPRTVRVLHFVGHAGTDTVTFAGRVSRHVTLKPGAYFVRVIAGSSRSKRLRFTVVR